MAKFKITNNRREILAFQAGSTSTGNRSGKGKSARLNRSKGVCFNA